MAVPHGAQVGRLRRLGAHVPFVRIALSRDETRQPLPGTYLSMVCLWLAESSRSQSARALTDGASRVPRQYQKGVRRDAWAGMLRALRTDTTVARGGRRASGTPGCADHPAAKRQRSLAAAR